MEQKEVTVKYEGKLEGIDATVLLPSLLGFVGLIQETTKEIYPEKKTNIIIKSTGRGSFLVNLNLMLDAFQKIASLFGNHSSASVNEIIGISFALILTKQFLRGKNPDKIEEKRDKVNIYLNNSQITITKDVLRLAKTNAKADKAISEMADPVLKDDRIEGIELLKDKKPAIKLTRGEIPYLTMPNPLLTENTRTISYKSQIIYPIKIVFTPGRKWEFTWRKEKISAFIKDEGFYNQLDTFSFKEGTRMIADIEIEQVFDYDKKDYVNREYSITKVYEVINPPEPPDLFRNAGAE